MPTKNPTLPLIRLAHPMAFMAFLHHIGAPVDRHLRRHGLPVLCNDPDVFVPLPRVWSFFDTAAHHEDPMVGWLTGAYVGDHNLNSSLLRKLETAPTLLQALRELARMARVEASDIHLGIHERQEDILFYTFYSNLRQVPGYMISQAYQLGVILGLIRYFLGRHWVPHEIGIEDSVAPSIAEEHFPGSRILTQQQTGYIAIPRSCLHRAACRTVLTDCGAGVAVPSQSFNYIDTLRAVLRAYLPDGYPTARFAAKLMSTSERTLTRRLAAHGVTYGALIDDVRFTMAKENLQNPDVRIVDVALSVGFNDQGDFTRMFRRVGGLTPREYRTATQS